ncbi:hypothetical protein ACBY01_03980 [Sphingomonas sp. ac-8]|uniref:hypothetical protein n=1 Tax=Sphingomonas sp. ac-8 TaxID=3242977 RepID=UPI003A8017BB
MRGWRAGVLALALAGCSSEPPAPAPTPTAKPTPAPTASSIDAGALAPGELPAPELAGAAPAAGKWSSGEGFARFVADDGSGAFALRCDAARRQLLFARSGAGEPGAMLRIVTGMAAASYPTTSSGRRVEARVSLDDRFLAALARAEGPLGVSIGEGPVLALTADPAIGRVLRECRGA